MPYLKCVACRIRVSEAGANADLTAATCPGCGELLEPGGPLAELVGFRAPDLHGDRSPYGDLLAAAVAARAQYQAP